MGAMLDPDVLAEAGFAHSSDRAVRMFRPGIEQGSDEHVAGDAADRIEMDVQRRAHAAAR